MAQKDSRSGRLSRTERDIDVLLRHAPHATEPVEIGSSPRGAFRILFIALCVVADAILVPWLLATLVGWAWVLVAPFVLAGLIYMEFMTYRMAFPERHVARHYPSDQIPRFHAEEAENAGVGESPGHSESGPR